MIKENLLLAIWHHIKELNKIPEQLKLLVCVVQVFRMGLGKYGALLHSWSGLLVVSNFSLNDELFYCTCNLDTLAMMIHRFPIPLMDGIVRLCVV